MPFLFRLFLRLDARLRDHSPSDLESSRAELAAVGAENDSAAPSAEGVGGEAAEPARADAAGRAGVAGGKARDAL